MVSKKERRTKDDVEEKPKHYVQKFSNDELLAEAVLAGNTPSFLVAKDGKVLPQDHIPLDDKILKPLEPLSYVNKPYTFGSSIELDSYLKR